jgi:biopolymer transport protein ExbB/TolQ
MSQPTRSVTSGRPTIWGSAAGWGVGLALTVLFYAVLPYIPVYQVEAQRYFCAHWIEYATTGLFWVGVATLVQKSLRIPAERAILAAEPLEGLEPLTGESATQTVDRIVGQLRLVARRAQQTHLAKRILEVCDYVRGRRSADGLEGQLSYLAELASGRLHDSYALIRTITWAVPILGFLGTVIGITMAIANVTPDQLESSLSEVTAGLAVAFDTTALSLGLSMILVFATFVIERQEQSVLDDIEDFARQQLVALFPTADAPAGPLLQAESQAAAHLLQQTETLVGWQMIEWEKALDGLRERWTGTLQKQQDFLDQALQSGLAHTLADHTQILAGVRLDFLQAFEQAARSINEQMVATQQALQEQQIAGVQSLQDTWQHCQADLQASRTDNEQFSRQLLETLAESIGRWQAQLQHSTESMTEQLTELRQQGGVLLRIVEQEEQLVRLEERLTQNLEAVRVVESLEETLLNLNAAVHLLSTKTRLKAA